MAQLSKSYYVCGPVCTFEAISNLVQKAPDCLTKFSIGLQVNHFDIHYFAANDDGSNSTTINGPPLRYYLKVNDSEVHGFIANGLRPKPEGVPLLRNTPQLNTLSPALRKMIWELTTECGTKERIKVTRQGNGFQV